MVVVLDHVEEVRIFGVRNVRKPLGNHPTIGIHRLAEIIKILQSEFQN